MSNNLWLRMLIFIARLVSVSVRPMLLQQEIFLLFYKCDLRAYEDGALQLMG